MNKNKLKPIAMSMGDPEGIGREITLKAWQILRQQSRHPPTPAFPAFFVIDDPDQLTAAPVKVITSAQQAACVFADHLPVLPIKVRNDAQAALTSLDRAIELARSDQIAAIITNPISKAKLHHIGWQHQGQTEYLAQSCGGAAVMMLATKTMRVALVTTHLPLAKVAISIDRQKIIIAGKILAASLTRDFGIPRP